MSVVQSNNVVESKATLGHPLAVASPDLRREGAYEITGVRARCSDPSKNCSARASSDAGDGKEGIGAYAGIGVTSVQGRQRGEDR